MKEKTLIEVKFQDLTLEVQKDLKHEWLLDTESVARGYGVSNKSIYAHKNRHKNELIENKHYLILQTVESGQRRNVVYWTKRGVINLGFHINSDVAVQFRSWAEDLILGLEKSNNTLDLKDYFDEKFRDLKNYVDTQNRDLKDYVDKKNEVLKTDLKDYIHQTTFSKKDYDSISPAFAEFASFVWNTVDEIRQGQKNEAKLLDDFSKEIANLKLDSVVLVEAIKRILASVNDSKSKSLFYVYLLESETGEQHKFGITENLYRRKKELERWDTLHILHKIPLTQEKDALLVERLLKRLFISKHLKGEWFELNDEDIILVKSL